VEHRGLTLVERLANLRRFTNKAGVINWATMRSSVLPGIVVSGIWVEFTLCL